MRRRQKMGKKYSKKLFTKTARGSHKRNHIVPMRGGYRL